MDNESNSSGLPAAAAAADAAGGDDDDQQRPATKKRTPSNWPPRHRPPASAGPFLDVAIAELAFRSSSLGDTFAAVRPICQSYVPKINQSLDQ